MFTIAALYHFTRFENHLELQKPLQKQCEDLWISGSLLLASEGINGTIAGTKEGIKEILVYIKKMPGCADLEYKTSFSKSPPFPEIKLLLFPLLVLVWNLHPTFSIFNFLEKFKF